MAEVISQTSLIGKNCRFIWLLLDLAFGPIQEIGLNLYKTCLTRQIRLMYSQRPTRGPLYNGHGKGLA